MLDSIDVTNPSEAWIDAKLDLTDIAKAIEAAGYIGPDEVEALRQAAVQAQKAADKLRAELTEARQVNAASVAREATLTQIRAQMANAGITGADLVGGA